MLRKKIMAAAIGIASFMPLAGQAATISLIDGGTVNPVSISDEYVFETTTPSPTGAVTRTFNFNAAAGDLPLSLMATNLTLKARGALTGAFMSWTDGITTITTALNPVLGGYGGTLTALLTSTSTWTLTYGWTSASGKATIQESLNVSAVPLPAGGLLLLGALGGVAALRRRKSV